VNIGQIDAGREELVGGAHPKKKDIKKPGPLRALA
jgi:hypothetical protein